MKLLSKIGVGIMIGASVLGAAENQTKTVMFIGDSISCGVGALNKENRFTTVTVKELNKAGNGITYVEKNAAVSGSSLCDTRWPVPKASAYPYKLQKAIEAKPDILVFQHGVNDQSTLSSIGDFAWSYRQLVREAKAALPKTTIVCLTITPTRRGGENAQFHDITNTIIQEIAAKEGVLLAQVNQALDGRLDLFPDGLHPNDSGHRIMGETVAKTILANRPIPAGKFDFVMRRKGEHRIMGYKIMISENTAKKGITCFYGVDKDGFEYSAYGDVTVIYPQLIFPKPVSCKLEGLDAAFSCTYDKYHRRIVVKLPATGGKIVKVKVFPENK